MPVSTKMSLDAKQFRFPNFYICSPFLISASRYNPAQFAKASPKNFEDKAYAMHEQLINIKNISDALREFQKEELYLRSLWSTLTYKELLAIGIHDKFQDIIKAKLNNYELDMNSFTMVPNQDFYSCIQFLNGSRLTSTNKKLTLHLYTDASQMNATRYPTDSWTFNGNVEIDKASGFYVIFAEEGYYPGYSKEYITVSSGLRTRISVSMTAHSELNTKSDPCRAVPSQVSVVDHLDPKHIITYKMGQSLCESYNWALKFHKSCGCVPLQYPIPANIHHKTFRCLNLSTSRTVEEIVQDQICVINLTEDRQVKDEIKQECHLQVPCERMMYTLKWSIATWPTENLVGHFVREIMNVSYNLRIADKENVPGWRNVLYAGNLTESMVRENVLKLVVRPNEELSTMISETRAYPAMNLFSDIGGILGLYLGMSLLAFCELVQSLLLAVQLSKYSYKTKTTPHRHPSSSVH